jgi:hypothetical protein
MEIVLSQYITQNKDAFLSKVVEIAGKLSIDPNWLMAVMYKESNLDPMARNSYTGATGLIQFMPATAVGLGTTTAALFTMTNVQQLDYVYKYFKPYSKKMKSYEDTYFAVFFPAAIGKPDEWVIQGGGLSASAVAAQNSGLDYNSDKKITVAEVKTWLYKGFSQGTIELLKKKQAL